MNDWENYNAGYTLQRLNTPASNPEAYRRSSPIHFSNNLKDHLLIIHGMVDNNVLFQDAVQLTEKLIQEGKSFEHYVLPAGKPRVHSRPDLDRRAAPHYRVVRSLSEMNLPRFYPILDTATLQRCGLDAIDAAEALLDRGGAHRAASA